MRLSTLLLLACSATPAEAQFFGFLADWSEVAPSDSRALVADVTATLTARSPWGQITNTESGKYWRSSVGQDRFDDSYGMSTFRDRRGPVIQARIDRELRLVEIQERTKSRTETGFTRDPWKILPVSFRKSGQRMMDGFKTTVMTAEDHGVSYEVWTSDELEMILYARYKTDRTVFEQRVQNIRLQEPDQSIVSFAAPSGFHIRVTCFSATEPERDAPRQTYEPGQSACGGNGR